jgi:hypothetical protein
VVVEILKYKFPNFWCILTSDTRWWNTLPLNTSKWAKYIGKIKLQVLGLIKHIITVEYLLNRLTYLYSENHYKEKNYLIIEIGSLYT